MAEIIVIGKDSRHAVAMSMQLNIARCRVITKPEDMDGLHSVTIILMPGHTENRRYEEFQMAIRCVMADGTSTCYTLEEGRFL